MKIIRLCLFLIPGILMLGCHHPGDGTISIGNKHFTYEIGRDGRNLHFTDRLTGADFLRSDTASWCASVTVEGKKYWVSDAHYSGGVLSLDFAGSEAKAEIKVTRHTDHINFKVKKISDNVEALNLLNIPLSLEGMPYEPFAACALSMNLFTRVRQLPALQSHLWAECYKRFGITGGEVNIIGIKGNDILPAIRGIMAKSADIPHSDKGGAWALQQKEGYGSYLMNFGTLTESTVDEWIEMCRSIGFNQIDNHGGSDFFRFGDFELNREKWPDGWETYRRINDRLHKAGISSIFHTYAFFIDKNSKYVTPVPSEDLGFFSSFTLAKPVMPGDSEIVVNESTENISTITGFFVRNSLSLRIGSEIIEFKDVRKVKPYAFIGCRRGANGTAISRHETGEKAWHLREMFGRFVPGPETKLFDEIALHTAEIINTAGFDGIYFDAIDGSDILAGDENFWYYGTKFIFTVAENLRRPVGMEMSSMAHHWWHFRSRWQAWDRPQRGYKRFEDIHSAAIKAARYFYPEQAKSNENEHGLWRGHLPLIRKYSAAENGNLLLPLHLGWWGNQTWNPPQVEPTFPDDIEYLCCRMLGNNAGMSMLGGVDRKTLDENPAFRRLLPIIKNYEELRHRNYFSDSVKAQLRQPGREYTLYKDNDSIWHLRRISYNKHQVAGTNHPSAEWTVDNEFARQPVRLRIEPLMTVRPFPDATGIPLADYRGTEKFTDELSAPGVRGGIMPSSEASPDGAKAWTFSAFNAGLTDQAGAYLRLSMKYEPWLDLSKNQALGVWVKGDGNGELLNLRIQSPKHIAHGARGDHFIKIDFKGWKYFELVEIESEEASNYIWPDSGFYVYDSYRHTVEFKAIDQLQVWYNNLPPEKEVKCLIGTVRALPMVAQTIMNPEIRIGNTSIIFRTTMESGMYLEFNSQGDCTLYGPRGEFIRKVETEGGIPFLEPGLNKVTFKCTGTKGISSRVKVTVISEGETLD